ARARAGVLSRGHRRDEDAIGRATLFEHEAECLFGLLELLAAAVLHAVDEALHRPEHAEHDGAERRVGVAHVAGQAHGGRCESGPGGGEPDDHTAGLARLADRLADEHARRRELHRALAGPARHAREREVLRRRFDREPRGELFHDRARADLEIVGAAVPVGRALRVAPAPVAGHVPAGTRARSSTRTVVARGTIVGGPAVGRATARARARTRARARVVAAAVAVFRARLVAPAIADLLAARAVAAAACGSTIVGASIGPGLPASVGRAARVAAVTGRTVVGLVAGLADLATRAGHGI